MKLRRVGLGCGQIVPKAHRGKKEIIVMEKSALGSYFTYQVRNSTLRVMLAIACFGGWLSVPFHRCLAVSG
jgi:hypothetical protein